MKTLTFKSNDVKARKEVFTRVCELMNLNIEAQIKNFDIGSTGNGLNVNIEKMFMFFNKHKLEGKFNFEDKTIEIHVPEKPLTGKKVVEAPESINSTAVDDGFKSVTTEEVEESIEQKVEDDTEKEEDDDSPF
ncbi:MAG: hypothetical protein ACTSRU_00720 [Candidatus Hodarchaeales archaeon]